MKPPIEEWKPRKEGNIFAIVGQPDSGKTALGHRIADLIHKDRLVYCSMSAQHGRPDYYRQIDKRIRDNTVILGPDASIIYHARTWQSNRNTILSKFQSVRRHRNVNMIWDVQNSGDLDVTILRQVDALILREPSILQGDYERPQMRKRYKRAEEMIEAAGGWDVTRAYVVSKRKEFVLEEIELPEYWNERISKDDLFRRGNKYMRPTCTDCSLKHLSQASILVHESRHGYPLHIHYARGHMAEAESELAKLYPDMAEMVRHERKLLENDKKYTPDFDGMLKKIERECVTCELAGNPGSTKKYSVRTHSECEREIAACVTQVGHSRVNPHAVCKAKIKCPA